MIGLLRDFKTLFLILLIFFTMCALIIYLEKKYEKPKAFSIGVA